MARIAGNDLPKNKRGLIGLTYIYGVGRSRASEILTRAEVDPNIKIGDWSDENIRVISKMLQDDYLVEGELRSCLLYTSPSPRDRQKSRMPSSA